MLGPLETTIFAGASSEFELVPANLANYACELILVLGELVLHGQMTRFADLFELHRFVMELFSEAGAGRGGNFKRQPEFHALQIALDMHGFNLVKVACEADCPTSTGSDAGLALTWRFEQLGSVRAIAASTGRRPCTIPTILCAYGKYCRAYNGMPYRRRDSARSA